LSRELGTVVYELIFINPKVKVLLVNATNGILGLFLEPIINLYSYLSMVNKIKQLSHKVSHMLSHPCRIDVSKMRHSNLSVRNSWIIG